MTKKEIYILIAVVALVGVIAYFLFGRKKEEKKSDETKTSSGTSGTSGKKSPPKSEVPQLVFNPIAFDAYKPLFFHTPRKEETGIEVDENTNPLDYDGDERVAVIYALIMKAIEDYNDYCDRKGWRARWRQCTNAPGGLEVAALNILIHGYIETGGYTDKYLQNSRMCLFNITVGSKNGPNYNTSPYIKDIYNHNYAGYTNRNDSGVIQKFRAYEYAIDAILDYLDLINRSPRYQDYVYSYRFNDSVFIKEIGKAGYYTANVENMARIAENLRPYLIKKIAADDAGETIAWFERQPKH
jgi:hypothetical protein